MKRRVVPSIIKSLARGWSKTRDPRRRDQAGLKCLRRLLRTAVNTRFGKAFGFTEILKEADLYTAYRQAVPVIDYDDWLAWLGGDIPKNDDDIKPLENVSWPGKVSIFCLSSGTSSGRTKYIPYSRTMAAVNRQAALDMYALMLNYDAEQAPLLRKTLYMSGSTNLKSNRHGALCGDMSGITKYLAPKAASSFMLPPPTISSLEPWSRRLEALIQLCLEDHRIGTISGIPIWQLTLLDAIAERAGKPLHEAMPNLRYLVHGGMSVVPYREKLMAHLGEHAMLIETYAASEIGIGAYQIPGETGMRFWECYKVFYEFEDQVGKITDSSGIVPGESYSLIVSGCSGLWRYRIGDRLTFRSVNPLILEGVSRDKTTSAFDEKVTEGELERAMASVSPSFADYALGPDTIARCHVWFVIADKAPDAAWLKALDDALRSDNADYDDYRGDGRINPPKVVAVPNRAAFLEALGRAEGGQRKFPRLLSPNEVSQIAGHRFKAMNGD